MLVTANKVTRRMFGRDLSIYIVEDPGLQIIIEMSVVVEVAQRCFGTNVMILIFGSLSFGLFGAFFFFFLFLPFSSVIFFFGGGVFFLLLCCEAEPRSGETCLSMNRLGIEESACVFLLNAFSPR